MDDGILFFNASTDFPGQDAFVIDQMSLDDWETMLARGWRHNGMTIYRNVVDLGENGQLHQVIPLRYRLDKNLDWSKSQRKIWRRNHDLAFKIRPLSITDEIHQLFEQHKQRFTYRIPESIFNFVSEYPTIPFPTFQMEIFYKDKLIAVTFIDITKHALSSTYAMFDLNESHRSLGVFTMILEMVIGVKNNKLFHYPGYAYREPSHMDYKKRFPNCEYFDFNTSDWQAIEL